MGLTRNFKETVKKRVESDPAFREALLREAVEAMLGGELDVGKAMIRDYINATDGFEALARKTHTQPKSLMRMFSKSGNPRARNLFNVIGELQRTANVRFHPVARKRGK